MSRMINRFNLGPNLGFKFVVLKGVSKRYYNLQLTGYHNFRSTVSNEKKSYLLGREFDGFIARKFHNTTSNLVKKELETNSQAQLPLANVALKKSVENQKQSEKKKYNLSSSLKVISGSIKYVWPKGDIATKARGFTVYVPILFKDIIDSLNVDVAAMGGMLSTASIALLVGYGVSRLTASIMQELRTAVFSRVQQDAIRRLARDIYRHLLNMDMKFHLSRETGGLVRAVDRGTKYR
ncbi:Iron-sulfur clusters transporter atm1, mitochondrial [Smittium mucronatum]|uniref:Iron-sulfur clusters transporter atm1, mitochondrial n=1 Tax=Smittium mucronatum TaxID=133383 RepID=A0A1R0H1J9_9FUNG|nr:Iron-sulfur clusters transporter atm1, mitochondrial [Smittium mucronatum]